MRKTYFIWFAMVAFLMLGCRNENFYNQENTNKNEQQYRILNAKDIPKIITFLKAKNNNSLDISIRSSSMLSKGGASLDSAQIETNFIVEANDGDKTFYVFPVKVNNSNDTDIYNAEVRLENGIVKDTRIIAYYPAEEWLQSRNYSSFSGTVASYDFSGNEQESMEYANGKKDCPNNPDGPGGPTGPGGGTGPGGAGNGPGHGPGNSGFPGGSSGGGTGGGGGGTGNGGNNNGCGEYTFSHDTFSENPVTGVRTKTGEIWMDECGNKKLISLNNDTGQYRLSSNCFDGSGVIIEDVPINYLSNLTGLLSTLHVNLSISEIQFLNSNKTLTRNLLSYLSSNNNLQGASTVSWAIQYLSMPQNVEKAFYYNQNPADLQYILFENIDAYDFENIQSVNTSADVISDILINEKKGTLSNLSFNWPGLGSLKEKVKGWISKGIYTTASYSRDYLVIPLSKYANNNPGKVNWINTNVIDKIRTEAVTPLVNFNENTMSWGDLFNIWLFELTPGKYANNIINFTNTSNVVNGNNIYNPSTNAVKNFPKGNNTPGGSLLNIQSELANGLGIGETKSGYFKYDVNAFYSTLSNANIGIQMLGSFPVTAKVLSKSGNTALVEFHIYNNLGWDSATRFIKGSNGNEGVLHDKPVGTGFHMGGTIRNNFTWTETVNF